MVKRFCDRCGCELDEINVNATSPRPRLEVGSWQFEIVSAYKDTWNVGDLCANCLRVLLNKALKARFMALRKGNGYEITPVDD